MVDLQAWDAKEGASPTVDEKEKFSKTLLMWDWYSSQFILGWKDQNIFEQTSCCDGLRAAHLKKINHSNTQGTTYT
jgi:hypothetical protein